MSVEKGSFATHQSKKHARVLNPKLIRLKKFFKFGRRWSTNPQKHLCFTWLAKVLSQSSRFDTTLDVACGNLNNYQFVKSSNYIGVDMNLASLEFGNRVFPEAKTEHLKIEELENAKLKGDLVICTQTIGVNQLFQSENTTMNVITLMQCTNSGGTLVFDTGLYSLPYIDEATTVLNGGFKTVNVREFGSFDWSTMMPVSVILAVLMQLIPALRTVNNSNRRFFVCEDRIG